MRIKSLIGSHYNSTLNSAFGDISFDENGVADVSEEAAISLSKMKSFELFDQTENIEATIEDEAPIPEPEIIEPVVSTEQPVVEEVKEEDQKEAVPTTETKIDIEALRKLSNIELRKLLTDSGYCTAEEAKKVEREDIIKLLT